MAKAGQPAGARRTDGRAPWRSSSTACEYYDDGVCMYIHGRRHINLVPRLSTRGPHACIWVGWCSPLTRIGSEYVWWTCICMSLRETNNHCTSRLYDGLLIGQHTSTKWRRWEREIRTDGRTCLWVRDLSLLPTYLPYVYLHTAGTATATVRPSVLWIVPSRPGPIHDDDALVYVCRLLARSHSSALSFVTTVLYIYS